MHGSLLEDYPSYKRAEHHWMFVSENGWISRWILHRTNPDGCFLAWGFSPKKTLKHGLEKYRSVYVTLDESCPDSTHDTPSYWYWPMAHHGTLAGELLMLTWKWCHGWAHQRRMKPSNRSTRYIMVYLLSSEWPKACRNMSWFLKPLCFPWLYNIPHHTTSHQITQSLIASTSSTIFSQDEFSHPFP